MKLTDVLRSRGFAIGAAAVLILVVLAAAGWLLLAPATRSMAGGVALTGSPEATKAAAQAYRVYFAKAGDDDSDAYLMDHSTFIYLMGPDGRYVRHFAHNAAPEEIAVAIEAAIAAS